MSAEKEKGAGPDGFPWHMAEPTKNYEERVAERNKELTIGLAMACGALVQMGAEESLLETLFNTLNDNHGDRRLFADFD